MTISTVEVNRSAPDTTTSINPRETDAADQFRQPERHAGGAGGRRDENEGDGNEDTGGDRQIKRFQRMFGGFIHAGIFSDFAVAAGKIRSNGLSVSN